MSRCEPDQNGFVGGRDGVGHSNPVERLSSCRDVRRGPCLVLLGRKFLLVIVVRVVEAELNVATFHRTSPVRKLSLRETRSARE